MEEIILGTEAKIRLYIHPVGGETPYKFPWEVELYTNPKKKVKVSSENCSPIEGEEYAFYVPFDSSELGIGELNADVIAYIEDSIFKDGLRTERVRIESIATIIP
jgi:hypothetical protein